MARYIHWQLCGKCGLEELVTGTNRSLREWLRVKTPKYCGISQSSATGKSRQEDQTVFIEKKEREVFIIDVANPGDDRVKDKDLEKIEKYQVLKDEIAKVWHMRKVILVPVVIGALGTVSVNFKKYMKQVGVKGSLDVIQKTALLGTAKILRKVLSL